MKILYIVDYYQPEIGYGSYYIPKELAKIGHSVTILTSNFYYPFPDYQETAGKILGQRRVAEGVNVKEGVRILRSKLWFEIFTRAFFGGHLTALKLCKPDLVIVDKTAGYSQVVMSVLKYIYGYRLVSVDAHLPSGFVAEGNLVAKEVFYWIFRFLFSGLVNRNVDKFIAVQEKTVHIMKKYYGVTGKIVHIPLGTDTETFSFNRNQRLKIRKKYGFSESEFVVIYTGKIIKEKGVDILFEAMEILINKSRKVRLMLVGGGSDDYLKLCYSRIANTHRNKVVEVGFVKAADLSKYYSASDLAVWPLQESMSMNDAASCGLPFIANNTMGAKFRIKNNNALLYDKGNCRDLAKKIDYLYQHRKIAKEMGARGKSLMDSELSWTRVASEYIK